MLLFNDNDNIRFINTEFIVQNSFNIHTLFNL